MMANRQFLTAFIHACSGRFIAARLICCIWLRCCVSFCLSTKYLKLFSDRCLLGCLCSSIICSWWLLDLADSFFFLFSTAFWSGMCLRQMLGILYVWTCPLHWCCNDNCTKISHYAVIRCDWKLRLLRYWTSAWMSSCGLPGDRIL